MKCFVTFEQSDRSLCSDFRKTGTQNGRIYCWQLRAHFTGVREKVGAPRTKRPTDLRTVDATLRSGDILFAKYTSKEHQDES